jgi:hypothetical protein
LKSNQSDFSFFVMRLLKGAMTRQTIDDWF